MNNNKYCCWTSLFKLLISIAIFNYISYSCYSQEISDQCIGCICYAGNGCNKDAGCHDGVCGPLLITWAYWADAGKYVIKGTNPDDPNAYAQCANDLYCAAETVRGYMAKFKRDCNGDGRIDCDDFARIHQKGPGYCHDPNLEHSKYYQEFSKCNTHFN